MHSMQPPRTKHIPIEKFDNFYLNTSNKIKFLHEIHFCNDIDMILKNILLPRVNTNVNVDVNLNELSNYCVFSIGKFNFSTVYLFDKEISCSKPQRVRGDCLCYFFEFEYEQNNVTNYCRFKVKWS